MSSNSAQAYRAFLLTPEDTDGNAIPDRWFRDTNADGTNDLMRDLGALGGTNAASLAWDVNNLGQVVGHASWTAKTGYTTIRAFLWQNGVITNLGTAGGQDSIARAINDAGQVAGEIRMASGISHAFLWKNGTFTDLGETYGVGDINNFGQTVDAHLSSGYLWTPTELNGTTGTFTRLGTLPPTQTDWYWGSASAALGINNAGQIVGHSIEGEAEWGTEIYRGFYWDNGVMHELPLQTPVAINDVGQIVGTQAGRAYLLTPVPADMPRLSISGAMVTEGHSGTRDAVFTVNLSHPSTELITVHYATADGTATAGSDYIAASHSLSFAPGQTTQPITVTVLGDRIPEPRTWQSSGGWIDEWFSMTLSNARGAFVENGSAVGIITDDEPLIMGGGATVVEGNSGSVTAIVRVMLSTTYDQTVTVDYSTADGGPLNYYGVATANNDYLPTSGRLTFLPEQTVHEVPITILADRIAEYFDVLDEFRTDIESLSLVLFNQSSVASVVGPAGVFIKDDEPTVSVSANVTISEGDLAIPGAVFTVQLSAPYDREVTVTYASSDADYPYSYPHIAVADSDYIATAGTLRFAPDETSKTVTIPILDDQIVEQTEYFFFDLGNTSSNAAVVRRNSHGVAEILDSEPPALSISDVTQVEGHAATTAITFTVSLSYPSTESISVGYSTANGSALAGIDYQAKSGSVTIPPGETSTSFTVQVYGDRLGEANETFFANLGNATNAIIADGLGIGTILDDEPAISISDVSKSEGRKGRTTLFNFTVTLSAAYDQPVTMSFRTVDGTAKTSDGDYLAKTGTLTFQPGQVKRTITIEVKGDTKKEAAETFYLDLFGNTGNSRFAKHRGWGTIANDD